MKKSVAPFLCGHGVDLEVDPSKSNGVNLDIQSRVGLNLLRAVDLLVKSETTSDFISASLHVDLN